MEIEVFRGGKRTSSNGETRNYSDELLDEIVDSFNKTKQLPHVIGHPKHNDPAWGWSKEMFRKGRSLYIVEEKVHPEFAKARKRGDYRRVSLSLFRPEDPGNPNPGKWSPRHVGWLGAMPPAIPELAVNDYSIPEFAIHQEGDLEFFIDFSIPMSDELAQEELTNQKAALEAGIAELEAKQAAFKQQQIKVEKDNFSALCDFSVAEGRTLPLPKDELIELYLCIPAESSVDFAAGDKEETPRDRFKKIIKNLPKTVNFNNYGSDPAPDPKNADPEVIGKRAREIKEKADLENRTLDFMAAYRQAKEELGVAYETN